jgi:hypothetical protein
MSLCSLLATNILVYMNYFLSKALFLIPEVALDMHINR